MSDYDITVTVPNQGPKGETGDTGPANTLAVGAVTTLAAGSPATATITGTAPNQTLALGIPQGPIGQPGSNALTGFDNTPLKALLWTNPDTDVVRERINNDNSKTFTNFGALPSSFFSTAADLEFYRDFAGRKTLDHGTGPSITFTRNSNATFFDADGVLQTATTNAPRFDHDPASSNVSRGLLIEEARTNSIRNSQAGGATNGVIGSGGVLPTNWGITANLNGLSAEIIGTGTESGFSYLDIKFSGTPTASSFLAINFDGATQIVAANGQTWTNSVFIKLAAGATTNATLTTGIVGRLADATAVSGQGQSAAFAPTLSGLTGQRTSVTYTVTDATVVRVQSRIVLAYTNGNPIDLTLRIAAPQLEQGAFPTSYIPTTTAAATRSADSAVVTPISSFYNQAEGTLFAEVRENGVSTVYGAASLDTNTSDNRIDLRRSDASNASSIVTNGGAAQATLLRSLANAAQAYRLIAAYATNDIVAVLNGGAATTDTSATLPTLTHFRIGALALVSPATGQGFFINGHIRKVAYWPRRLSNTLLQQLTT